jgi:hypothetical protein
MEWILGFFIGFLVFVVVFLIVWATTWKGFLSFLIGVVVGLVVWVGLGLMFESVGDSYRLLKIKDGKVTESNRTITLDWDNPAKYSQDIQWFHGSVLPYEVDYSSAVGIIESSFGVNYRIYYRVADEDLSEMQKYYDKVIKEKISLYDIQKSARFAIQHCLWSEAAAGQILKYRIMQVAEEFFEDYGIKVIGIE